MSKRHYLCSHFPVTQKVHLSQKRALNAQFWRIHVVTQMWRLRQVCTPVPSAAPQLPCLLGRPLPTTTAPRIVAHSRNYQPTRNTTFTPTRKVHYPVSHRKACIHDLNGFWFNLNEVTNVYLILNIPNQWIHKNFDNIQRWEQNISGEVETISTNATWSDATQYVNKQTSHASNRAHCEMHTRDM